VAALDFAALENFWRSELGERIRAQAANVRRELPFTARFDPAELDAIVHAQNGTERRSPIRREGFSDEFVVVQGVADLVVMLPEEIWLLDFKTDAMTKLEVEAKKSFYAPQLQLYALALEQIYGRRVTNAWLHFLACNETVTVTSATSAPELPHPAG
jgi:ATP-dependent helicase/nuclease subunit A